MIPGRARLGPSREDPSITPRAHLRAPHPTNRAPSSAVLPLPPCGATPHRGPALREPAGARGRKDAAPTGPRHPLPASPGPTHCEVLPASSCRSRRRPLLLRGAAGSAPPPAPAAAEPPETRGRGARGTAAKPRAPGGGCEPRGGGPRAAGRGSGRPRSRSGSLSRERAPPPGPPPQRQSHRETTPQVAAPRAPVTWKS